MAVSRQKKESILGDLTEQIKKTRMVVFVNFHGLSTLATQKLRSLMKGNSARYQVAKKTLIRKALEKSGLADEMPDLAGEIGLILAATEAEISGLAKNLVKFIKEHKELSVIGGLMENKFFGSEVISQLATVLSRKVLLTQLVYTLNSPLRRLVGGLEGNLRKFVIVISKIKK